MIYADNAATTRVSDLAYEKMFSFLREQYGNPSSQYSFGARAKEAIEKARGKIARAIGATPSEIVFTSGGSESNAWILRSAAQIRGPVHIITSSIEHPSILNACRALEHVGAEITYLPVNHYGIIDANDVLAAIRPETKLVSIMLANNEIGTVQPIAEIGALLREQRVPFHTDAVQAVGHFPVNVRDLQVDFLTASAHKFNGPKGVGFLYIKSGRELPPLVFGGEQENRRRAGTENVPGIVAASYALEENIALMADTEKRLADMTDALIKGIQEKLPEVHVNGDGGAAGGRLAGLVNLRFNKVSGEALMQLLDLKGVCVSTSAACASGNNHTSHVLLALGLSEQQANSSIRISFGRYNAMNEVSVIVDCVCSAFYKIVDNR